jgi:hypothetical protein
LIVTLLRKKLKSGLASLPQPKNEYNITLPDVANDLEEDSTSNKIEDAEDIERKKRRALIEQEEAKYVHDNDSNSKSFSSLLNAELHSLYCFLI